MAGRGDATPRVAALSRRRKAATARLRVRRARADDIVRVADIGRSTYLAHFATFWTPDRLALFLDSHFALERVARDLAGDEVRYELAYAERQLVGFAKTIRDQPVPGVPGERGRELQKIYFLGDAVGRGYGALLLARVIRIARREGEPAVWLNVLRTNKAAARFYAAYGFERVGTLVFHNGRRDVGMLTMRLRLG